MGSKKSQAPSAHPVAVDPVEVARRSFPGASSFVRAESFAAVGGVALVVCRGVVVALSAEDVERFLAAALPAGSLVVKRSDLELLAAAPPDEGRVD